MKRVRPEECAERKKSYKNNKERRKDKKRKD
jgi:hypothetical protein